MAKPEPVTGPPSHHLDLELTVQGELFALSGVFTLAEGMAAFDRWVAKVGGAAGGLTPGQVTMLKARGIRTAERTEAAATALEALDSETP